MAEVRPEPPFAGVYKAPVKIVDELVDSTSRTFRMRLELLKPKSKPNSEVPAGLTCMAAL